MPPFSLRDPFAPTLRFQPRPFQAIELHDRAIVIAHDLPLPLHLPLPFRDLILSTLFFALRQSHYDYPAELFFCPETTVWTLFSGNM